MVQLKNIIVCDTGSSFTKIGYGGSDFPSHIFPSIVGRPNNYCSEDNRNLKLYDIMVGYEAAKYRNFLDIKNPINCNIINNWDDMQHLYDYTFDKLKISPNECRLMLNKVPNNPKKNNEKMIEVMFEEYNYKSIYIADQAVLSLYANGLLSGLVVDCGDSCTNISAVYDGFIIPEGVKSLDVGGRDITKYLINLFHLRGYYFNRSADFEIVRRIKEKLCYIAYDINFEQKLALETTVLVEPYELPDGRTIRIGAEKFEAPEILFEPNGGDYDFETRGLSEEIYQTIQNMHGDIRGEFWNHVLLTGGSSMYRGLSSRLQKDITELYLNKELKGDTTKLRRFRVRIEDPPRRKHMVYLGGAVLAEIMKDHDGFWMNKNDYNEEGVNILRKC